MMWKVVNFAFSNIYQQPGTLKASAQNSSLRGDVFIVQQNQHNRKKAAMVAKVLRGINEFRLIYSVKKHRHHRGWGRGKLWSNHCCEREREVPPPTRRSSSCDAMLFEEMMFTRWL